MRSAGARRGRVEDAGAKRRVRRLVEQLHAVTALHLGLVQRLVGELQRAVRSALAASSCGASGIRMGGSSSYA